MSGLFRRLSSRRSAGPEANEPHTAAEPGTTDAPAQTPSEESGHRSLLTDPAAEYGPQGDPATDATRILPGDPLTAHEQRPAATSGDPLTAPQGAPHVPAGDPLAGPQSQPIAPHVAAGDPRNVPAAPHAAAGDPRNEPAGPHAAAGDPRNEPAAPHAPAGDPRTEPATPHAPVGDAPLAPAGDPLAAPRNEPAAPYAAAGDPLRAAAPLNERAAPAPYVPPAAAYVQPTFQAPYGHAIPPGAPEPMPIADLPAGLDPDELAAAPVTSARRGKLRRRVAFLRAARELLLRDLGGFVYELHRTAHDIEADAHKRLRETKLTRLGRVDAELHELEMLLDDVRRQVLVREPGVGGECPQCTELFSSSAHFCSNCGFPLTESARRSLARAPEPQPEVAAVSPVVAPAAAPVDQPTQEIPPLDPDHPAAGAADFQWPRRESTPGPTPASWTAEPSGLAGIPREPAVPSSSGATPTADETPTTEEPIAGTPATTGAAKAGAADEPHAVDAGTPHAAEPVAASAETAVAGAADEPGAADAETPVEDERGGVDSERPAATAADEPRAVDAHATGVGAADETRAADAETPVAGTADEPRAADAETAADAVDEPRSVDAEPPVAETADEPQAVDAETPSAHDAPPADEATPGVEEPPADAAAGDDEASLDTTNEADRRDVPDGEAPSNGSVLHPVERHQ